MRRLLVSIMIVAVLTLAFSTATTAQAMPPEVTMPGSELHQFQSAGGTQYELYSVDSALRSS